ncbi:hypothetical protein SteCoe_28729 [Stentor coeruleus]|uniref:Protein kinase domain-containing protein n=1 Tax=Stentor coeruleus TaxID=5963 RepID=A0A1R2B7J3_9CILI|nr:hypothetical protein SteCoe_28729 [Stentor coeruleus]
MHEIALFNIFTSLIPEIAEDTDISNIDLYAILKQYFNIDLLVYGLSGPTLTEEMFIYSCIQLIAKYTLQAPLGYKKSAPYSSIISITSTILSQSTREEIWALYSEGLEKEIKKCKSLDDLLKWIELIKDLSKYINIGDKLNFLLENKFYVLGNDRIDGLFMSTQKEEYIKILELLINAQNLGLSSNKLNDYLAGNLYQYIEKLLEKNDKRSKDEGYELLKYAQLLNIQDNMISQNILDKAKQKDQNTNQNTVELKLFDDWKKIDDIAVSEGSSIYRLRITLYKTIIGNVVVKNYELNPECPQRGFSEYLEKLQIFKDEGIILAKLSSIASKENCFLKFYMQVAIENKLLLVMEYQKDTLSSKIKSLKINKRSLSDDYFFYIVPKLLQSFALMEELKIFHRDIKPDNILVTDEMPWEMKIIDFGVSRYDKNKDDTYETESIGTPPYMAPEVFKNLSLGKKIPYCISKADVYSLGITLLQMYFPDKTINLLSESSSNNPTISSSVSFESSASDFQSSSIFNDIKISWLRNLIVNMTNNNPDKRPRFKECLKYVSSMTSLYQTIIPNFDENSLKKKIKEISNKTSPKFSIEVNSYESFLGPVAIKSYRALQNKDDLNQVSSEIYVLKKLSKFRNMNNCFVNFYFVYDEDDMKKIAMEYCERSLRMFIDEMRNSMRKFEIYELKSIIPKMITSFALMESIGIYHQNICPEHFIINNQHPREVKIISFSAAECVSKYGVCVSYNLRGNINYRAPEAEDLYLEEGITAKYKMGKADVFSLGLTILEMSLLKDINGLNKVHTNELLISYVNQIEILWLRVLLQKMLHLDYKKRPTFSECLAYVPLSPIVDQNMTVS